VDDGNWKGEEAMGTKSLLIADQDDHWTEPLRAWLQEQGVQVDVVKGVSDLIRKVRGGNVSVVLMGDELEGIRTSDLVSLIRGIRDDLQVIVVSAEASLGWVRRLRGAGIFYQALKPVDHEEIRAAVQCAFKKAEKERLREAFFPFLVQGGVPA
jgi:two-component system response regulator GlrR